MVLNLIQTLTLFTLLFSFPAEASGIPGTDSIEFSAAFLMERQGWKTKFGTTLAVKGKGLGVLRLRYSLLLFSKYSAKTALHGKERGHFSQNLRYVT